MARRRDQPRWPRGTPVRPDGGGPGGGRFRGDVDVPGTGGDWAERIAGRLPKPVGGKPVKPGLLDPSQPREPQGGVAMSGYGEPVSTHGGVIRAVLRDNPGRTAMVRVTPDEPWTRVVAALDSDASPGTVYLYGERETNPMAMGGNRYLFATLAPDQQVAVRWGLEPTTGGGEAPPQSGGRFPARELGELRASYGDIQILNTRGEWDTITSIEWDTALQGYRIRTANDDQDTRIAGSGEREVRYRHPDASPPPRRRVSNDELAAALAPATPGADLPDMDPTVRSLVGGDDGLTGLSNEQLHALAGDYGVSRGWLRWQVPTPEQRREAIAGLRARGAITPDVMRRLPETQHRAWAQRQIELDQIARGGPGPARVPSSREEYNEEIIDATRILLGVADTTPTQRFERWEQDRGAGQAMRAALASDYQAMPGTDWVDEDAYDIVSDWLTEYEHALGRGDQAEADAAVDFLASYTGLDAVFSPPEPSSGTITETAGQLYDRFDVNARPTIRYAGETFLLTTAVFRAADSQIELYGPEGFVARVDRDTPIRVVSPGSLPRREPTPPPPRRAGIPAPPDDELPLGAGTIGELLEEVATSDQYRYQQIPLNPELDRRIRAIWEFDDPDSGLSSRISTILPGFGATISIGGYVYDARGQQVGNWSRVISFQERNSRGGGPGVYHAYFRLNPDTQGGGFTTRWFEQVLKQYRDEGVESVTVHANIDVGGYTWTHWFDFESPDDADALLYNLRTRMLRGEWTLTQETQDEFEQLRQRSIDGEHVSAREIAMLGYRQRMTGDPDVDADRDQGFVLPTRPDGTPMEMWLGKRFMLGQSWSGIMRL